MAMTYEITGVPGLAVRVGQALETWGSRAGRRIEHDEMMVRVQLQRAHDEAVEARREAYAGMYSILR